MPNIKLYIYGAIGIFLLTSIGGTYLYIKHLQSENATLTANNAKLELAVSEQAEAIATMESDAAEVGKQVILINKQFQEARGENNVLRKKLAKHDVAYLAEKRPKSIKRIVNKGTKDVGRCFEILSGAPLTEKEINATKKSQANGSCPDIANPNYKAKP